MPNLDATASLCDCCLIWLANDEPCDHGHEPSDEHPNGLCGSSDMPRHVVPSTDEADRHDFAKSRCGGCGTDLAGGRTDCPIVCDCRDRDPWAGSTVPHDDDCPSYA